PEFDILIGIDSLPGRIRPATAAANETDHERRFFAGGVSGVFGKGKGSQAHGRNGGGGGQEFAAGSHKGNSQSWRIIGFEELGMFSFQRKGAESQSCKGKEKGEGMTTTASGVFLSPPSFIPLSSSPFASPRLCCFALKTNDVDSLNRTDLKLPEPN